MKIGLLTFFVALLIIIGACEKKKTGTVKVSNNSSSLHANVLLGKVNGISWEAYNEGFSSSKNSSFNLAGKSNASDPYSEISFNMAYTATVGINSFGTSTLTARFRDTLGYYYTAKTGTINITAVDTFKYGYKILKGNFSFMTDTISGKFYNVTNGVVDFKL